MSSTAVHRSLSQSVVEKIAAAEGVNPLDLEEPLYEVIDPDALDVLFAPGNGEPRPAGRVSFDYCGYRVTVASDGTVTLDDEPPTSEESL